MNDAGAEYPTTIGADAVFKGQMQFEKGARLLGKYDGEITSKGQMVIAEGAEFSGEAHAGNIRVEGRVKGNLHASGKVQLAASGRLEGDIQAARLEVAEGAVLVGRCVVGDKAGVQAAQAAKPVSAPVETAPRPHAPQDVRQGDKQVAAVKK